MEVTAVIRGRCCSEDRIIVIQSVVRCVVARRRVTDARSAVGKTRRVSVTMSRVVSVAVSVSMMPVSKRAL